MRRHTRPSWIASSLLVLVLAGPAVAEHFEIELSVDTGKQKTRAFADTSPPPQGHHPRPVCRAKKGEALTLQFFMTSNFPHDAIRNVTVRYFIVPEAKAGQEEVPTPGPNAVLDGHFVMDFKPNTGKVGLRQGFHVDRPGVYLVRVQSENTDTDHEHFSAMDLVVE